MENRRSQLLKESRSAPRNAAWAVRVPLSRASAAAALRLLPNVRACTVGEDLWLRGEKCDRAIAIALAQLAPSANFTITEDGALIPFGQSLPNGYLPAEVAWVSLAEFLQPKFHSAAIPAVLPNTIPLQLSRSSTERPANVLLTSIAALSQYAQVASAIRLERLLLASDGARAIIWGEPLLPLPGQRFAEQSGIAAPCGFDWQPAIDPLSLRRLLNLAEGDLALLLPDGTWHHLPATAFVRARRSAIRFTSKGAQS